MPLATCHLDGMVTVYLQGDIDIASVPGLVTAVDELLDAGAERLVFDGSRVEFIDLRGLHPVLHARRRLRELDDSTRVWFQHPATSVRRLLQATGLDALVPSLT